MYRIFWGGLFFLLLFSGWGGIFLCFFVLNFSVLLLFQMGANFLLLWVCCLQDRVGALQTLNISGVFSSFFGGGLFFIFYFFLLNTIDVSIFLYCCYFKWLISLCCGFVACRVMCGHHRHRRHLDVRPEGGRVPGRLLVQPGAVLLVRQLNHLRCRG